jgi:3-oxoacyl-[acyl-carrier-protein] synthase II
MGKKQFGLIPVHQLDNEGLMGIRVVITGMGVMSSIGVGKGPFWEGCIQGKSGIRPISGFDTSRLSSKLGGQLPDIDFRQYIKPANLRRMDRIGRIVVSAVKMALDDSGLELENEDPDRVGIMVGTGLGSSKSVDLYYRGLIEEGPTGATPLLFQTAVPNSICSHSSLEFGIRGINTTFSHKEASVESAIVFAFHLLRKGDAQVIFVGGGDEISEPLYHVYATLGSLSPQKSPFPEGMRPFDAHRNGFALGEGSGVLVMEELEHALQRRARIYGEVLSHGLTGSNCGILNYDKGGDFLSRAMAKAAGGRRVDYICAAANSTRDLDVAETRAIKATFGPEARTIRVSSIKSMIGEFDGSGGLRACATLLAIYHGVIPPTINYSTSDPDCDLDYTPNEAREQEIGTALLNGFSNGGSNISILFGRYA